MQHDHRCRKSAGLVAVMASIYLSVCVKRASSVVISTSVVKFSASSTFWDLLERVWSDENPQETFEFCPEDVSAVSIAKDTSFSNSCQDVKLQHEVAVCQLFDSKYVSFNLKPTKNNQHSAQPQASHRSAYDVLMNSTRERVLPSKISRSGELKATEKLYNDLLDYLGHLGVGWSRDCVETTGKRFVLSLRDTLWYLDGQHAKLAERGLALPIRLSRFDHTVRPLCVHCKIAGKNLVTRGPKNFTAKKPRLDSVQP